MLQKETELDLPVFVPINVLVMHLLHKVCMNLKHEKKNLQKTKSSEILKDQGITLLACDEEMFIIIVDSKRRSRRKLLSSRIDQRRRSSSSSRGRGRRSYSAIALRFLFFHSVKTFFSSEVMNPSFKCVYFPNLRKQTFIFFPKKTFFYYL